MTRHIHPRLPSRSLLCKSYRGWSGTSLLIIIFLKFKTALFSVVDRLNSQNAVHICAIRGHSFLHNFYENSHHDLEVWSCT